MRKKLLIVPAFIMLAASIFAAPGINGKFGIELRGGYSLINPSAFNDLYSTAFQYGFFSGNQTLNGIDITGTKLTNMAMESGNIQYMVNPNFALYFRNDFLYCENSDQIVETDVSSDPLIDSHAAFNVGYYGIGGRYYFGIDGVKGFYPYVSLDLGMFIQYDSFWEIWVNPDMYTMPNSADQYQCIDFKDSFFGANVEAGAVYMFTDTIGISGGMGYRLASAAVKAEATSQAFKNILATGDLATVNLSGLYFSGGLNMFFGGSQAAAGSTAKAATGGTGAGDKYEQYGDKFYTAKQYQNALKYYGAAMKLDPKKAAIYKKIGMCYYYMKDMAKAKLYFNYYLRLNPNDAAMKKWLGQ
jgi:hypothetical protein